MALNEKLESTIESKKLKRNVSYGHLIKMDCFKLYKKNIEYAQKVQV
jgi:hypothetical protein